MPKYVLLAIVFITVSAIAAEKEYSHLTTLSSPLKKGGSYLVPLTGDFIATCKQSCRDLLLLEETGEPAPFVLVDHEIAAKVATKTALKIAAYDKKNGVQKLTLQLPEQAPLKEVIRLEVATTSRNFVKKADLACADNPEELKPLTQTLLFDYSAEVDHRKFAIDFAAVKCRSFVLELSDIVNGKTEDIAVLFRTGGLEFAVVEGHLANPLIIGSVTLHAADGHDAQRIMTQALVKPDKRVEEAKKTELFITTALPAESIRLIIGDALYDRPLTIERFNTERKEWYHIGQGRLRSDGTTVADTVAVRLTEPDTYKIVIENGDSKPLAIEHVILEWVEKLLIITPAKTGTYALYSGSEMAVPQQYDLARIVRQDNWSEREYTGVNIVKIGFNPEYQAAWESAALSRNALIAAVIALVVALGWVLYRAVRGR